MNHETAYSLIVSMLISFRNFLHIPKFIANCIHIYAYLTANHIYKNLFLHLPSSIFVNHLSCGILSTYF